MQMARTIRYICCRFPYNFDEPDNTKIKQLITI